MKQAARDPAEENEELRARLEESEAMLRAIRNGDIDELVTDDTGQPMHTVGVIRDIQEHKTADAALHISETRYRRLFEAAHDGILILDPDTRKIVDANPFMTTLIGYPHEQLIGLELYQIGFLADAQASKDMFQKLKATGQVRYENLPLQSQQGGVRDVEVVANLYDDGGHSVVQCSIRDITERKRFELALRQHEERQAFLLKLSDALRPLRDPFEVQTATMRLVVEHLDVIRASYFKMDPDQDGFSLTSSYERGALPIPDHMRLSDFAPDIADGYRKGRTLFIEDAETEAPTEVEREAYRAIGVRAGIGVPLVKDGLLLGIFGVHSATPRHWSVAEVQLLEDVADRVWTAVDRARADMALQSGAARDAFRVRLTDALRGAANAEEAQEAAMRALGNHFQASRVMFGEGDEGSTETFTNHREYCRPPAMPSSVGQHRWDAFGPYVETELLAGRTLVVDDVHTHPDHSTEELTAYETLGIKAYLAVPLVRQKRIIAYLAVNHTTTHTWTPDEIALAEETAERIWAAVERARIEATLAKSDNRFRMAISNSSITVFELDLDLRYTWLYNAKLGFDETSPLGRTNAELLGPAVGDRLDVVKRRALETGQHSGQEVTLERPGHGLNHFELSVEPRRGPDGQINGVIGTSIDITERRRIEMELREHQNFRDRIFDVLPGVLYIFDLDENRIVFVNNPADQTFSSEEIAGMGAEVVPNLMHPDDHQGFQDHIARIRTLGPGATATFEYRMRNKADEWRWYMGTHTVFLLDGGGVAHQFIGVSLEITDRKQAEAVLRENARRQSFLLELSDALRAEPSAEAIANRALRMLFDEMRLNRCYIGIYRLAEDTAEFPLQMHDNSLPPLPAQVRLSDFPKALQIASDGTLVIDDVVKMDELSDSERASFVSLGMGALIVATLREGENNPLWAIVTVSASPRVWTPGEVSLVEEVAERTWAAVERARVEERLHTAHDMFRQLIDRSPFGVYVIDANFHLVQISEGGQKAFANVRPLIGRDFTEVVRAVWSDPFAGEVIARFRHTLATGEPFYAKTIERRADINATEAYDWKIERVILPDGRFGVVCHFYDLSERIHHEEHVRLLMGEVNHRSKNMLSLVQAIAKRTVATHPEDFIERFGERVQALSTSQDLLVKSEWKAVSLGELVRAQLAHFDDAFDSRITLDGPQLAIKASASQALGMALHELATNAAKYGALSNTSGRVIISWSLPTDAAGKDRFTISWIESGGPPIAKPTRLGFGSTVTDSMIKMSLGGDVKVDFAPTGLVWHINCPAEGLLDGSAPPAPQSNGDAVKENPVQATVRRVLVVEDEPLIAMDIASTLSDAGYDVIGPASSVAQALALIALSGCDAAVLDTNLGAETAEPVAHELIRRSIPFISTSGYAREQQPEIMRTVPLLSKPLKPDVLIAEIARCLEDRNAS